MPPPADCCLNSRPSHSPQHFRPFLPVIQTPLLSVVPGQSADPLGALWKCRVSGPTPDPPNQSLHFSQDPRGFVSAFSLRSLFRGGGLIILPGQGLVESSSKTTSYLKRPPPVGFPLCDLLGKSKTMETVKQPVATSWVSGEGGRNRWNTGDF